MGEKKLGRELKSLNNIIARYVANNRPPIHDRSVAHDRAHSHIGPNAGVHTHGIMTEMHAEILGYLFESQGKVIYQKDIEEAFTMRKSTASKMLTLIEHNGMIQRIPSREDARHKQIILTDRAIKMHARMTEGMKQFDDRLRKGISEKDLEVFYRVIDQIKNNLKESM